MFTEPDNPAQTDGTPRPSRARGAGRVESARHADGRGLRSACRALSTREPWWFTVGPRYLSRLTPREMTRTDSISAETDSRAISILARGESGMVSVGLKADEFVTDT